MVQVASEAQTTPETPPGTKPPVPETLEDTGLSAAFVTDLLLRTLYLQGARTGSQLEATLRLSYAILDEPLLDMQQRRLVEVRGSTGHGRMGHTFDITGEGRARAREIMQTNRYVGPAPIPLGDYWESVRQQSTRGLQIGREAIREGFSHLVFDEDFLDTLGPAINSGKSIFLYGEAGNGKTSIAEAVAEMMGSQVYVPYAVEIDGQVISIYDPVAHRPTKAEPVEAAPETPSYLRPVPDADPRFALVRRPVVMVGGELTLDELELQFDAQTGVYRAPPQVKANCGVFIIDDFGRQRARPRDLLNRWMVPLDRHMDFLSLPMGHKLPVPFECLLIFATNLDPTELVEEAFLRRIQYKILVDDPSRDEYRAIFRRCCEAAGLDPSGDGVDLVFREFYEGRDLAPRACHPRDIVNHVLDLARYLGVEPEASGRMLEMACRSYFLDVPSTEMHPGASA
ncbi:MAG: ATP-binding protein [Gemmatimonadota bacterium]|nr:ATP-binding protein [Gemmatimonadota bacterium]